mgnify:CR=1 FL=1
MTAKIHSLGIVGRKAGMSRVFTEDGKSVPVTLIEATPNRITQIKTVDADGYSAVQVTAGVKRAALVNKTGAYLADLLGVEDAVVVSCASAGIAQSVVLTRTPGRASSMPAGETLAGAIAGLIWAQLGNPDREDRWRAMHCVRRLARFGQGENWMSWIALDDLTDIYVRSLIDARLSGPVNATAPHPVTNAEFTAALGKPLIDRVALPAGVVAGQRLAQQQVVVGDAQPCACGRATLRRHELLQHPAQAGGGEGQPHLPPVILRHLPPHQAALHQRRHGAARDLVAARDGVELKHAAYRGTQPAMLDLLGGNISAVSGPIGDITQHLSTGKVRILGVSGTKRSRFAPNVPTFEEQGVKGASHSEWFAFLLPPKANADVVARMNAALKTALAAPDVVEGLAGFGLEAMSSSPAELAELLKRDTAKWGPIVKQIGFTAEG